MNKIPIPLMTPSEAKKLIKELDLTGVQFSQLLEKSRNYVSDFNREGVPENIVLVLKLAVECKRLGGDPIAVIKETLSRENP